MFYALTIKTNEKISNEKNRTNLRAMVPNHLRVVGLERSSDLARPKVALKVK
jgi:hypothetical protein